MKIAEPLIDYIKREYGTSKAYSQATGKSTPQISTYISKQYWIIDGVLYAPVKLNRIKK